MFGNALYSARRFARRGLDAGQEPTSGRHIRSRGRRRTRAAASVATVALLGGLMVTSASGVNADGVVGQGFTITPADLRFILDQIKIAEAHVVNTTTATGPCGALLGTGANQIPSPLLPFGLRTVDGSCNNLHRRPRDVRCCRPGVPPSHDACVQPSRAAAVRHRRPRPGGCWPTDQLRADHRKRVGLRATNGQQPDRRPDVRQPLRSRRRRVPRAHPGQLRRSRCRTPLTGVDESVDCVPEHQTLFIPNVTTDVGLSPPFNGLFTIFGQFFDHGLDKITNGGAELCSYR